MDIEIKDQLVNSNFTVMKKSKISANTQILPTIQQMKIKQDILIGDITKNKARLNIDRSKMQKGIYYNKTYASVANQSIVRLIL